MAINWTSDKRRLADLTPWDHNPRQLKEAQAEHLEISLDKFGLAIPFLISPDNEIYDGHQRQALMRVMNQYGADSLVDVRVSDRPLTTQERKELVIRLHENTGEWDFDTLANVYDADELKEWGFPDWKLESVAGWGGEELPSEDAEPQISRADELQKEWGVEPGQLWRLPSRTQGQEHRLICGDCTDAAVVGRLSPPFDMMFTDPPYGVDYTGGHFHSGDVNIKREREKLKGDTVNMYAMFLPVVLPLVDGPCYMWFAASVGKPVYDAITTNGGEIHAMLVWHKTNATYAAMNAQYKQRHEPFMYFKRKGQTLMWCGPTDERTLWELPRDAVNDLHPTQKPVALAQRAIGNHDAVTVLDCFAGSGSTIIAAENLSRQCRAIEISPAYVAVALQRYKDAFGIEPELVDSRDS